MSLLFNFQSTFYKKLIFLKIKLLIYLDNFLLNQLINKRLNVYFFDKLTNIKFNLFKINYDLLSTHLKNPDLKQFIDFQATLHYYKLENYLKTNPERIIWDNVFSKRIFLNNIEL